MKAQDEAEFADFVAASSLPALRTAFAVCGDRHLAEDALQSALVRAYRAWPRVRDADSSQAYLRRMVVNELLGWRRRRSWGTTTRMGREPSEPGPEDGIVEHQLVWCLVGELPPRQRAVVVLRFYEGLSEAEIAEALGVRRGTVKSQASAALSHLRAALAMHDPDLSARSTRGG